MPYALCSSSNQPAPRPSSTRPPDIWSTWATWMASTPGSRKVPAVISVPSRMRLVSRASPARVIQASVGPGSPSDDAHAEIVVGAEEGVEAEVLGGLGDGEQGVVARPLLGLGEDAKIHASILHARPSVNAIGPTGVARATVGWKSVNPVQGARLGPVTGAER